jgi:antitoxin component of MazEF toxin-antitoxin module
MKAQLIRIGNSRGLRLPQKLLELYRIEEGDEMELKETAEGILLLPLRDSSAKLSWADAYKEMAEEVAESEEWADWDIATGDGLHDSEEGFIPCI